MSGVDIGIMPFSKMMGVEITNASEEGVTGTLKVRPDLCTSRQIIHGGAIMAFADALGAIGATFSLPEGASGTTTLESKTNFIRGANEGTTVLGVTSPVHIGRRSSVWQTKISREDGKTVAVVTQTQLVL